MKDSQTQQFKTCSAIGESFDEFQSVNLSLGLPIAVGSGERGAHSVVVAIDPRGKAPKFGNPTGLRLIEPSSKPVNLPKGDHRPKILRELVCQFEFFLEPSEGIKLPNLPQLQLAR